MSAFATRVVVQQLPHAFDEFGVEMFVQQDAPKAQ
jgi:hypothetical protein